MLFIEPSTNGSSSGDGIFFLLCTTEHGLLQALHCNLAASFLPGHYFHDIVSLAKGWPSEARVSSSILGHEKPHP
jgi:hypothetical protein